MNKILVIQNVSDSHPGMVGQGLLSAGIELDVRDCAKGASLQIQPADYQGLMILGGPQSVASDPMPAHLPTAAELIADFHAQAKPILGICLGGQLLARTLGGHVHRQRHQEFGFIPIRAEADDDVIPKPPQDLRVMQWHDDCFTPPPKAEHCLATEGCAQQAFRLGHSIGLQCHPEIDEGILKEWLRIRRDEYRDYETIAQAALDAETYLPAAKAYGHELGRRFAALIMRVS